MKGPLEGVRVIELAGLGALPYGALKLADMGADVIRVERTGDVPASPSPRPHSFWDRGRRSIAVDLKHPSGVATVLRMVEHVDAFLESFRPGVAERLGVGPDAVLGRNPRIVYGRLTGWGQEGPLARAAGHSLNYEAITGVIRAIGPRGGPPVPLLQILGDFAGGGLHLAYGVVCALYEAKRSGRGQVVDAAMVDGVMSLLGVFYALHASGVRTDEMGENLFDGGAPFYNVYETKDGRWVSVAPIGPHFWSLLLQARDRSGRAPRPARPEPRWPESARAPRVCLPDADARRGWCAAPRGTDACFAPVLTFGEAQHHSHNVARGAFLADASAPELKPTPRLDRTPGEPGPSAGLAGRGHRRRVDRSASAVTRSALCARSERSSDARTPRPTARPALRSAIALHHVLDPPLRGRREELLQIGVVPPAHDLAVPKLVHRDELDGAALARRPVPLLGVLGEDEVALGDHVPRMVVDRLERLEPEPEARSDLLRTPRDVVVRCRDVGVLAVLREVGADGVEVTPVEIAPEALDDLSIPGRFAHAPPS
jgi:alpha-methylacyl-CoA racemase